MAIVIIGIALVAIGYAFYWLDSGTCSRVELGYNCKGDKCECRKAAHV